MTSSPRHTPRPIEGIATDGPPTGSFVVHDADTLRDWAVTGELPAQTEEAAEGEDVDLELDVDEAAFEATSGGRAQGVMGSLAEFTILELVQMFGVTGRTGLFRVTTPGGEGRIYMDRGKAYAAIWVDPDVEPLQGVDAIRAVGGVQTGQFRFGPLTEDPPAGNLDLGMTGLLLELATATSEQSAGADGALMLTDALPDEAALQVLPYRLARPLPGRLADLSAAELDVLQQVHEGQPVRAEDPGFQTLFASLLKRGYVTGA